jgi:predicted lipoprotein with Yx(FWY)xxD motif
MSFTRSRYVALARLAVALAMLTAIRAIPLLAQEAPPATVTVRQDPVLGALLTDAQGWTLYIFTRDRPGVSVCTGQCAVNWPPLTIEGDPVAPPDLPGELGVIVRPDGGRQVTYNGMPLYYFAGDAQPGDVNGHGVGGVWLIAQPAAPQPAEAPPATAPAPEQPPMPTTPTPAPAQPAPGYGYGYGYGY